MTVAELYALMGNASLLNYGNNNPRGDRSRYKYRGDFVYRIGFAGDHYYLTVGSGGYQDDWTVHAQADDEIEVSA